MFAIIKSLIDLIAGIISGTFRLICTFISSCFGLAFVAVLVIGLVALALLHVF